MTVCGYGGVEKGPDLYWVDCWFDLSECVDELSLTLFWDEETEVGLLIWRQFYEALRCSLLAPDSPSDSLTGWAVAQLPEICSARSWGTQSTCLEPCLWSLGSQTHPFASLEGLWTLWDETTAESLELYIWNAGVVFLFLFLFFYCGKNLRLNTEGVLTKRTDGSSEPLDDFHCDLGHLGSVLLLSCLEGVQS